MLSLGDADRLAGVDRAPEPQAPGQLGRLVGQDVAKHIGSNHDVEAIRRPDQQGCGGIDD